LALTVVLATASSSGAASKAQPRTIATVPGHLWGFAASGHRLAWLRQRKDRPPAEVFDLRSRQRVRISSLRRNACDGPDPSPGIGVAGERVLWEEEYGSNEADHVLVYSAALHDRRTREIDGGDIGFDTNYDGPFPVASEQGRLVFYRHDDCIEDDVCRPDGV